jgi:hypothetical protein
MRIGRQISIWRGVNIGEIATTTPGNQDLAARFGIMVYDENAFAAFCCCCGTHKARPAGSEDDDIILLA